MISVVIATYGGDEWVQLARTRALPSVANQDAHEIVVHHEPTLSIGPARNAAAEHTSGEWLAFLDADDELHPNYLAEMRATIATTTERPVLLQPSVEYRRKNRSLTPTLLGPGDLRHDNFLVVGTLVQRSLFMQVGGFGDYPHGFEDWSLWAKCWKAGASIVQVPSAIYIAYINPQSKHRQMWRNRREQVATHLRVQAELFPEGV